MDFELMTNSFPKLLSASLITLKLLSASLIIGLLIGLLFAILRLNKNIFINKFAYGYSYLFRGTPLLVQIFIIYYGLGNLLGNNEYLKTTFLWVILKEPYWCAIIAFALNTGAYTSEILRSAFQTIKPGIIEAGKSLGISNKIIFYKIQIPIAIRQSLPAYGNEIILMMKGTSLASTVTIMDLTGVAKYIISTTFKPIEVFIVAGGIYLFMTFIIHNLIKYLEKKYSFQ
jgi:octopine/nopaline transport system permease protein